MTAPQVFGLTTQMRWALLVIQEWQRIYSVSPTHRELADELEKKSLAQVHDILRRLRDRGYIAWRPRSARSITVLRSVPVPQLPTFVGLFEPPPELALELASPPPAAPTRAKRQCRERIADLLPASDPTP